MFSKLRSKCVNSIPLRKLGPFGRQQRITGLNAEKKVEYSDLLGLSHGCLHPCEDLGRFIDTHRCPVRAIKYADVDLRCLDINMPDKSQEEMRLNLRILDSDKERRTQLTNSLQSLLMANGCTVYRLIKMNSVS